MWRLSITVIIFAALIKAAAVYAALYTGGAAPSGSRLLAAPPSVALFPGVIFGDSTDHFDASNSLRAILGAVNELSSELSSTERPQTVASLYGDASKPEGRNAEGTEEEADTSLAVQMAGVPNQAPIRIFTGADTSRILSQLFSGIMDVDDGTFARREERWTGEASPRRTVGGGSGAIEPLTSDFISGSFLATQSFGAGSIWIESGPAGPGRIALVPEFEKEDDPRKTSEILAFVLSLLNPYFYGALVLLLLFSVAWSVRSRYSANDADL